MQLMVAATAASYAQCPRDIWIIYFNPWQRQVVEASGLACETILDVKISGCRFVVYKIPLARLGALAGITAD